MFLLYANCFYHVLQCSIDSLLERTIKHMLFLQNVTKHADKLSKSANTKVRKSLDFLMLIEVVSL